MRVDQAHCLGPEERNRAAGARTNGAAAILFFYATENDESGYASGV